MLLSDSVHTSSFQSLGIITVRCFQWSKHCNVARLELVRCVGWKATQGDLVSEAVLQNLELLVGAEAIANKYPRLTIGSLSGLRIKYTCEPLQA